MIDVSVKLPIITKKNIKLVSVRIGILHLSTNLYMSSTNLYS